ncbi:DUF6371 domain-containing protein [Roseomonas sp. GC11]|uniref:DUF6371 domain-containing protein n=1 Tax=Roseomonas sp. GC11 TaxID=2950546 RepID=UPI00210A2A71|nr:DUF6371 domain-containing protein [Roseomonas sp. GC11]
MSPATPQVEIVMPATLPLPEVIRHTKRGTPAKVWHYLDRAGKLLFAVARFNTPAGGKEVLPLIQAGMAWRWAAPPEPCPLYGLDRLAARPDAPVLLVEGEKAADAAASLFPEHVAMTWQGGSSATGKADLSPLQGRRVVIWPDPGRQAAAALVPLLEDIGAAAVAVVKVPAGWPEKCGLADTPPDGVTPEVLAGLLTEAEAQATEAREEASERRAEVGRLARLDAVALALALPQAAASLGLPPAALREAVKAAQREAHRAERGHGPAGGNGLDPDARGRADLFVSGSDLPDTARDLAALLAGTPHIFDRGGPVRVVFDAQRGGMVAEPLTLNAVIYEAHAIARPWRFRRDRDGAQIPELVTLPERVALLYLAMRGRWGLRPLDGIASAPLLAEDGGLRVVEGYDPGTRLWGERVPAVEVPEAPDMEDARAALLRLRLFFQTFAFADAVRITPPGAAVPVVDISQPPGRDESAALVALMTAVCRPSLRLAPGLLVRAPAYSGAGTGKGLLSRILCAIAYGQAPRAMTAGSDAAELEKRIVAALIGAEQMLFLDNMNGTALRSDTLASAITERPASVRILGSSTIMLLNPTAFIIAAGNGLAPSEDLARRFLTVELDAGMEDPEARDFKGDLLRDAMERRADLLRDVLTIWRWGRLARDLPVGRPLGSFNDWARWCRDPLLALGCADPAERIAEAKANDPRRRQIAELFAAWWQHHRDMPMKATSLHEDVRALADPANKSRQSLAAILGKLDGTRAAGFVLKRIKTDANWSVTLYALQRDAEPSAPEKHGGHRGHEEFRGLSDGKIKDFEPKDAPYAQALQKTIGATIGARKENGDKSLGTGAPYAPYDPHASPAQVAGEDEDDIIL